MTPRPLALADELRKLRARVERGSWDFADDPHGLKLRADIAVLDAAIAQLEQREQERGEMKPTETCSVCGHAAHRRGDCWVAVGVDKHGDDAMCPCIAHILAATPSPEEP